MRSRQEHNKISDQIYKELAEAPWFLGLMSRDMINGLFQNEGDFCVCSLGGPANADLLLAVKDDHTKVYHFPLNTDGTLWWLDVDKDNSTKSVIKLVDRFRTTNLPGLDLKLIEPCRPPTWYLRRRQIHVTSKMLGSGNFCDVFRGTVDRRQAAIKVCKSSNSMADMDELAEASTALLQEATVMMILKHDNVISFYGICCERHPVMIAMEICPGGALVDHLQKQGKKITDQEKVKFAQEAAAGMLHLHEHKLVHRDLAARNCLISQTGVIKISDFGLSKIVTDFKPENLAKQQIPLRWMAPETLMTKPQFSMASDVWAYGVLLFEVFNLGIKPWPEWEHKRIATHIRRNQMPELPNYNNPPEETPQKIKDLIVNGLWVTEPKDRYSFTRICDELGQITISIPPPLPCECTVNELPGVHAMSQDELAVLRETTSDLAMEVHGSNQFEGINVEDKNNVDEFERGQKFREKSRQRKVRNKEEVVKTSLKDQQKRLKTKRRGRGLNNTLSQDSANSNSQSEEFGNERKAKARPKASHKKQSTIIN